MTCVAPQTRAFWMYEMQRKTDEQVRESYRAAEDGWRRYRKISQRHYHDWTIFRACCIREMRKRGLDLGT